MEGKGAEWLGKAVHGVQDMRGGMWNIDDDDVKCQHLVPLAFVYKLFLEDGNFENDPQISKQEGVQ